MSRPEWYSGLTEVVNHVANEVAARTLRGQANFVVVSPDMASILESSRHFTPSYALDARGQVDFGSYRLGAEAVGTIEGRYTVYRCNDFPRNKILVGYKGEDELNVGMVYAPYVPLIISPILLNTEDAQPRQVMSTRYAVKMLRTDYFGTVTVTDLYNV
jgi:hypothetical protein